MATALPVTHPIDVNQLIDSQGINEKYLEEILASNPVNRTSNITACMTQPSHIWNPESLKTQMLKTSRLNSDAENIFHRELNKNLNTDLVNVVFDNLKLLDFKELPIIPLLTSDSFICDWLTRVKSQFDLKTPQKIKEADLKLAKENLQADRIFIGSSSW